MTRRDFLVRSAAHRRRRVPQHRACPACSPAANAASGDRRARRRTRRRSGSPSRRTARPRCTSSRPRWASTSAPASRRSSPKSWKSSGTTCAWTRRSRAWRTSRSTAWPTRSTAAASPPSSTASSRAGAAGRIALVEAGAKLLGAKLADCHAENSRVIDKASGRSIGYGEILQKVKIDRKFAYPDDFKKIKLKDRGQYKIIGKSVPALDIPAKTNGQAKYGIDVFLPNMAYGALVVPRTRYALQGAVASTTPKRRRSPASSRRSRSTTRWASAPAGWSRWPRRSRPR